MATTRNSGGDRYEQQRGNAWVGNLACFVQLLFNQAWVTNDYAIITLLEKARGKTWL